MSLDLNGYIHQSYKNPNVNILKDLGAEDELVKYLTETPGNTNFNVVKNWVSGESGNGRIFTLPKYGSLETPEMKSLDGLFLFNTMLPYLLEQNIEIKFLNEKVTEVYWGQEESTDSYIFTIITENDTYTLISMTDHDGTYFYPTLNGESIGDITFDIGTKKYFFFATETDDAPFESIVGLYNTGSQPICPYTRSKYRRIAFDSEIGDGRQFNEDLKFPAITEDIWYYAY